MNWQPIAGMLFFIGSVVCLAIQLKLQNDNTTETINQCRELHPGELMTDKERKRLYDAVMRVGKK